MGSKKRQARERQVAAFREQMGSLDLGDAFERERVRDRDLEERKQAARRERGCERKQRYASRSEALDAIAACEAHGTHGLSLYRCSYCNGWHLTSHSWE